ncbi:L-2-hydroxyglutarate dehydrogenase, mitochondrial [Chlamydiales bacterium STE3]|nr:L-2-hydroxyglutarate dehydrogenase, mitochondrial [Chlamydiales bacterium STE3]
MNKFNAVIIGGGIVGLAVALQILRKHPHISLAILEKEQRLAAHQTGHNSGVIHSGIYYKPGSLKAKNCREGVQSLLKFCEEKGIVYKKVGKAIVALNEEELPRLRELERRGIANGVPGLRMISKEEYREIEPSGHALKALYSPETGIIDFTQVAEAYAQEIRERGGVIFLSQKVCEYKSLGNSKTLVTSTQEFEADWIINCAGLHADRIAHLADNKISKKQIIPFRGEYYELSAHKNDLVKGLIYPVPDPKFPFLGVHLSKTMEGKVEAGPNAVLALSREGYKKNCFSFQDVKDYLSYSGFWMMAARYWKIGAYELYRSFSKKAFLKSLQRLIPSLEEKDLMPAEAGVRSQIVLPNGKMQDDFLIHANNRMIHVLNAPSPAATSSLSIGATIASYVDF